MTTQLTAPRPQTHVYRLGDRKLSVSALAQEKKGETCVKHQGGMTSQPSQQVHDYWLRDYIPVSTQ